MDPRNHILNGDADPQGKGQFWGLSRHSKALAIFAAMVAIKRDHSIANNVMQQKR